MDKSINSQDRPLMDVPILTSAEDKLERSAIAHSFAESISAINPKNGLVVGILAPWGNGKSSFINLMREQFKKELDLTVIDFNPWMFSGSEQLVDFFLTQIGAELELQNKDKYGEIAGRFAEYADVLKPSLQLIGGTRGAIIADMFGKAFGFAAKSRKPETSAISLRNTITEKLSELEKPIVVVIDDIDRLTSSEIREIFQLVRLSASFPNVIYLLAFDRKRVELALTENEISGRAYLEKIIQISFDVWAVSSFVDGETL